MKKAIICFLICAFAGFATAQDRVDEKAWTLSLDQGVYDKYIWRGIQFNEEGVNQGSVDLSYDTGDYGTFGVNYWYNLDMDDENGTAGQISEADYTFYWNKDLGESGFNLELGFIYYDFSEVDLGSTKEVYAALGYDTFLSPSLTVYYDIEDVDGFYVELAVGHSFDLSEYLVEGSSFDLGASIGWADDDMASGYYGATDVTTGFTNYKLSAGLNIPVLDYFTITPSIAYYALLDDADTQAGEDDDIIVGVNLNFTF